jgi:hypothetical protein
VAVDLASGRTATVRLDMPRPAVQLDRVTVLGKRSPASRDLDGFLARKRSGLGVYFTRADIERLNPFDVTDVLRTTAGLRVTPLGSRGNAIRGRGGCVPAVFIDGAPIAGAADELDLFVRPNAVAAIEVYRGPSEVPAQFNGVGSGGALTSGAGCGGAIVVWTRR